MTIESEPLADGVTKIRLCGRLDITGAEEIDMRFSGLVSAASSVIVDLAGVTFLASIGIRTLVANAKALALRGGSMVLFDPQPLVADVLRATGIADIIPVLEGQGAAMEGLRAARSLRA